MREGPTSERFLRNLEYNLLRDGGLTQGTEHGDMNCIVWQAPCLASL